MESGLQGRRKAGAPSEWDNGGGKLFSSGKGLNNFLTHPLKVSIFYVLKGILITIRNPYSPIAVDSSINQQPVLSKLLVLTSPVLSGLLLHAWQLRLDWYELLESASIALEQGLHLPFCLPSLCYKMLPVFPWGTYFPCEEKPI